jgi:hypothetical protein
LAVLLGAVLPSAAGEPIYFITHHGQDTLVLGTVGAVDQQSIQFQPKIVVAGQPIHSTVLIHSPSFAASRPRLKTGDLVLLPVNRDRNAYTLAGGISKVSSLNPQTLKILESDFRFSNRIILQWYVNSCGQAAEFSQSGSTVFVQHTDGKQLPIAQQRNGKWVPLHKANLYGQACNQLRLQNQVAAQSPWWLGTIASSIGAAVFLTYGGIRLAKHRIPNGR